MFALSEESKERIGKLIEVARVAIHYGYLPMILYLGMVTSGPCAHGASLPVEAIAGFSSGVLQTFVGHPFDVVKTRLQIHERKVGHDEPLTSKGVIKQLQHSERPFAGFYRAITPNILGNSISWAAFFALKAYTERSIISARAHFSSSSSDGASTSKYRLAWYDHGLASIVAGFGTQAVTNPIWVVKTRMLAADPSVSQGYRSTWNTISTIRKEGYKGFYSGFWISTTGVLQGGIQFAIYDELKKVYRNGAFGPVYAKQDGGRDIGIPMGWTVAFSVAAKVASVTAVYPYQVIRSRLQVDDAERKFGKGVRGVSVQLYKEAGLRGFWKGLVPAVGRTLPATCVTFLVYEWLKPHLSQRFDAGSGGRREP
ncbi:mitochondrial carrier [Cryphonectria parasitica EP155]|uniref:Mitochondrial carrier n=1 Tax=Cryphonectria parasitica (strain ATCC 38755 / EP155) TaxID=660469 RepID=A0A9P4YD95_CRYP1|nr:mitochondrial carrier [Cryphonectria parasitica EP155]KAF3771256.1 mitochondrial carrier [Cryphonectria parasitica EP155]